MGSYCNIATLAPSGRSDRKSIDLEAYAKVNLFLRVGPKRADGYHDIATLFQSISLADRIHIECRTGVTRGAFLLSVSDPAIPTDEKNTIHKAHRFLCGRYPAARTARFRVRVQKRIPVGAGLGGGSADAAGFLIGACRLLGLKPPTSRKDLDAISRLVGADVPFCMKGGTAGGMGRGEILKPVKPLPARKVFLVIPAARVSTKNAYRDIDRRRRTKNLTTAVYARSLCLVVGAIRLRQVVSESLNDFQRPACQAHPDLAQIEEKLRRYGLSSMSGSGSAFFVLPKRNVSLRDIRSDIPTSAAVIESRFVRRGVRMV